MSMREDSAAKLRRLLAEAKARIVELESRGPVTVEVVREVVREVPGPERIIQPAPVTTVVERVVYQDNPEHIATIRSLQEKLCQSISQSGS